ncbi:hypothetical protein CsSME_00041494 [Camellia sinensis var. sinensis]
MSNAVHFTLLKFISLLSCSFYFIKVSSSLLVPDNSSVGDGTYFLQEYMIPRGSTSFCLFDTRCLSDDSSKNMEMLKHWMTKGVRHGELVVRDSDSSTLKTRMMCKARQSGYYSSEIRMVNFVIFVVNGLSVLKSLDSDDEAEKNYTQLIATTFNCPFLSFKGTKASIIFVLKNLTLTSLTFSILLILCVFS